MTSQNFPIFRKGTAKKYMEKASRERNAKGWFEKRECTWSNKMESMCPDDSYEKHPATSVDGDKTGLKLKSSSSSLRAGDLEDPGW